MQQAFLGLDPREGSEVAPNCYVRSADAEHYEIDSVVSLI